MVREKKEKTVREVTVKLVFPRATKYLERPKAEDGRMLTDLREKVVAFVDDGRPNADVALASIRAELVEVFHIRPVQVEHKTFGLEPADHLPADVFKRLLAEADAVVIGIAS
ncbi:MAG: hypothetical protein HYX92_20800 [Chloroflexi bacterium]|nr:hypothetical protein [Chloroflexota bacterium]